MEAGMKGPYPVLLGHGKLSRGGKSRGESGKEDVLETRRTGHKQKFRVKS